MRKGIGDNVKMDFFKQIKYLFVTLIASIISAFTIHVFITPAGFAPSGVDGISVMLQHITSVNTGWYTFLINVPLLITALLVFRKRYVIYTLIFTVLSSLMLIVLQKMNFYQLYLPDEKLLIALLSGALLGVRTAIMLKIEASTGGMDILAGIVQQKNNHINIERIISITCCIISILSFFVYKNILSVLLSFVQMFVFDRAAEYVLKDTRHAVEFKIITKNPEKLANKIINDLKHGATIVESKGAFGDDDSFIIITVVNIRQIPELLNMVKEDDSSFVYYTEAKGVIGNFRWNRDDEVK